MKLLLLGCYSISLPPPPPGYCFLALASFFGFVFISFFFFFVFFGFVSVADMKNDAETIFTTKSARRPNLASSRPSATRGFGYSGAEAGKGQASGVLGPVQPPHSKLIDGPLQRWENCTGGRDALHPAKALLPAIPQEPPPPSDRSGVVRLLARNQSG